MHFQELSLDELTAQLLVAPIDRPRLPSDSKASDEPEDDDPEATDAQVDGEGVYLLM